MSSGRTPRHRVAPHGRLPGVALGAAATAVVGVLSWAGQGSLAMWIGSATVSGTTISSGSLALEKPVCDWRLTQTGGTVTGTPSPGPTVPYTGQPLQPDDTVVGTCHTTVRGRGDHLRVQVMASFVTAPPAPFSTTQSTITASPSAVLTVGDAVTVTATLVVPPTDTSNPSADQTSAWDANLITVGAVQAPPS